MLDIVIVNLCFFNFLFHFEVISHFLLLLFVYFLHFCYCYSLMCLTLCVSSHPWFVLFAFVSWISLVF